MADPIPPYVALRRWRGSHRMTLYAWGRPRRFPNLPAPVPRWFDVAADARVLAHVHWQPAPHTRPTLLCLHGLEGSSEAHYMRGLASKAWARGWNAVLLNQRNCGGTEHLSAGLYHSGLTADPRAVIEQLVAVDGLPAIAVVGYSLGGNLTVKLAGEYGTAAPAALRACAAVSPTIDLACCVDALERPGNRVYQWHFVRSLKARMRRKARRFPGRFDLAPLPGIRTVRAFDDAYTAPHHAFDGAADYYHRASAVRLADRISIPTLIVTAADDPFVPPAQFAVPAVAGNPNVHVVVTPEGGHCGFVSAPRHGSDGYWAEDVVMAFMADRVDAASRHAPSGHARSQA
jgi:predicted alpha/beta-fold hydrolase